MVRLGAGIVLVLLIVAALFYWNSETPAPDASGALPHGDQHAAQPAVVATGDRAPENASIADRAQVSPDPNAKEYIVRGIVLGDNRSPDLTRVRVLAYLGAAHDTSGLLPGSIAGSQRRSRSPAFLLNGDPIAETAVGIDGRFELRTTSRHVRITIDDDFYLLAVPEIVHVPSESRATDIVLSPLLGGIVRGRLLGERSADVASISLTLEANPISILRDARAMMAAMMAATRPAAIPTDDRSFVFRAIAPMAELKFSAYGGRATADQSEPALQPGEVRDVILSVTTAAMLSVQVVDEAGNAINNASVTARPDKQSGMGMSAMLRAQRQGTNESGFCTFASMMPGSYHIDAMVAGRTGDTKSVEVTVEHESQQVQLVLREGGVVTGIVQTPDGEPVVGASVAHHPSENIPMIGDLAEQLGPQYLSQVARGGAETNEKGEFRLSGLADSNEFLVVGAHPDYSAGVTREVRMGDEGVVITLQPMSSVLGQVVEAGSNEPITQFTAAILRTSFLVLKLPIAHEVIEDEQGKFALSGISADSYTVQIEAEGFGTITKSIKVPQGQSLDIGVLQLQRAATVRGIVRDEHGKPIANALVRKRQGAMADNPILAMLTGSSARTYSDAQGNFTLSPITPGRLQLLASATDFASGRSERMKLAPGDALEGIVIELGHGGTIHGKLECGPNQQPEDFLLVVQHQVSQNTTSVDFAPDGSFVVENLDPGAYQVQAMAAELMSSFGGMDAKPGEGLNLGKLMRQMTDGVVSQRCRVRSGEIAEVTIDVQDLTIGAQWLIEVEIGGKQQDVGMIEAVSLDTGTLRVAMFQDGIATFGRMQPGRHRLQVRSGLTMTPVGAPQDLVYPEGVEEHTSLLSLPGGELRGRVVDADSNEALRSAIVRLHHDGHSERDDPIGMCLTDADGEFAFTGLTDGTYSLVAAEPFGTNGQNKASRQSGIRVASGTTTGEIVLRSQPAAGASVLVTTLEGRPLAGATVLCVDAEGRPLGSLGMAATGQDGRAWFGGMADGQARIVGRASGYAPGASNLQRLAAEQSTKFTLVLGNGAATHLSVVDDTGKRLRGVSLTARFDDNPWLPTVVLVQSIGSDGTLDLGRLGPGNWTFRATHPAIGTVTHKRTIRGSSPVTIVISK
tara:strand:- start:131805 stop:135209 length:3405 start_codon:yes stop_codon:yes gene_type:complete